jgi:hypothetical protein
MILETILKFIWLCQLINKYIIYFISYLISEMKINYIIFVGNTGDLLHKIACNCNSSYILNENSLKLSIHAYYQTEIFIVLFWHVYWPSIEGVIAPFWIWILHKIACNCNSSYILNGNSLKLCIHAYYQTEIFIVLFWHVYWSSIEGVIAPFWIW